MKLLLTKFLKKQKQTHFEQKTDENATHNK